MRERIVRKCLEMAGWAASLAAVGGGYLYRHHRLASVALLIAAGVLALVVSLHLYHRARGPRSLFWLVLPARCQRCGSREALRRWHRGWHCQDVSACRDRARARARLKALKGSTP